MENLEHPEYGGWGGRLVQSKEQVNRWEDGTPAADFNPYSDSMDLAYAQSRWVPVIQEDFAARADWCILDYDQANHAPSISVKGEKNRLVKSGSKIRLKFKLKDPDKDKVALKLWQYKEAGSGKHSLIISANGSNGASIEIPNAATSGETYHLIAEGRDGGSPAMTRYERIIFTIE